VSAAHAHRHASSRHPSESWDLSRQGHRITGKDPSFRWGDARGWVRAFLAAFLLLLAAPAFAQSFPAFTGLVTDAAGVLPADRKAALEKTLEDFQQRSGRQLVVATIPDLGGYDIRDYGYRLGRTWGVGLKGADNGAILIVAPKDRKVSIEVGKRLEPVMTDALSSIIVQQKVIPAFKAGDMPAGVEAGAQAIMQQLSLPDDQAKAEADKAAVAFDKAHKRSRGGSGGGIPFGLIFWVVIVAVIAISHFARRASGPWASRRYDHSGSGSNWPIWLWAASEIVDDLSRSGRGGGGGSSWGGGGRSSGGSDGSWGGGGFTGGGGGDFGGGGASGSW